MRHVCHLHADLQPAHHTRDCGNFRGGEADRRRESAIAAHGKRRRRAGAADRERRVDAKVDSQKDRRAAAGAGKKPEPDLRHEPRHPKSADRAAGLSRSGAERTVPLAGRDEKLSGSCLQPGAAAQNTDRRAVPLLSGLRCAGASHSA